MSIPQPAHDIGGYVITKDRSSGAIHLRFRDGARLLVDERCQTDQSGAYDVVGASDLDAVHEDRFCRYCFPRRTSPEEPANG